jgi:hypothetical protein
MSDGVRREMARYLRVLLDEGRALRARVLDSAPSSNEQELEVQNWANRVRQELGPRPDLAAQFDAPVALTAAFVGFRNYLGELLDHQLRVLDAIVKSLLG